MPRFKVLKGVAHNIGHSFTSLMNYAGDDYSMGHILRFARETGCSTLTIDFVSGRGQPACLLGEPISSLPEWYTEMFWRMVETSGSSRDLVRSANLTLAYDLRRSLPVVINRFRASPYVCDVSIIDVRGKQYRATFSGSWYSERDLRTKLARTWRKLTMSLKKGKSKR